MEKCTQNGQKNSNKLSCGDSYEMIHFQYKPVTGSAYGKKWYPIRAVHVHNILKSGAISLRIDNIIYTEFTEECIAALKKAEFWEKLQNKG